MALLFCLAKNVERCASDIITFSVKESYFTAYTAQLYTSVVYTLIVRWNETKIWPACEVVLILSENKHIIYIMVS